MPRKPTTDFDALWKQLRKSELQPNYSKGFTVAEWAERFKRSEGATNRCLRDAVKKGLMVKDKDVRLTDDDRMFPVAVYRQTK